MPPDRKDAGWWTQAEPGAFPSASQVAGSRNALQGCTRSGLSPGAALVRLCGRMKDERCWLRESKSWEGLVREAGRKQQEGRPEGQEERTPADASALDGSLQPTDHGGPFPLNPEHLCCQQCFTVDGDG